MQETPKTLSTIGGRKSKNLKDITMDNPQEINRYISLAMSKGGGKAFIVCLNSILRDYT